MTWGAGYTKNKTVGRDNFLVSPYITSLTPHQDTLNYFNRFRSARRCAERMEGTHIHTDSSPWTLTFRKRF